MKRKRSNRKGKKRKRSNKNSKDEDGLIRRTGELQYDIRKRT